MNSASPRPRELLGYFEEFIAESATGDWPKALGARLYPPDLPSDQCERPLGYAGRRTLTITESVRLNKGHRDVVVRASPSRPLRVMTMLQRLEGREL